jgi:ABC-type nitrate/sulfonate/bicarbonate transport system permease component
MLVVNSAETGPSTGRAVDDGPVPGGWTAGGRLAAVSRARAGAAVVGSAQRRTILGQVLTVAILLAVWEAFSYSALAAAAEVPGALETLQRLAALTVEAVFWSDVANTVVSWGLGLALSLVVAVPLGLWIGSFRRATDSTRFLIDFMRTIPPVAVIPLALLILGPTREMEVLLVVLGAGWPLVVQAIYAVRQMDPVLEQVACSYRLSAWHRARYLYGPSALPIVWTGVRIASVISLLVCVAAEMIGGAPGLGQALNRSLLANQNASVFAYVVVAGALGVVINAFLIAVGSRILQWHPSIRGRRQR